MCAIVGHKSQIHSSKVKSVLQKTTMVNEASRKDFLFIGIDNLR